MTVTGIQIEIAILLAVCSASPNVGSQLRDRNLLGNQQAPPDRRDDATQTDSHLEHGSDLGRIAEHRPTITAPLSHIHRSDFSPRFGAVSEWQGPSMRVRRCRQTGTPIVRFVLVASDGQPTSVAEEGTMLREMSALPALGPSWSKRSRPR